MGAWFGFHTIYWVGFAAWCVPLTFLWLTYIFFRSYAYVINIRKLIAILVLIVAISVFSQVLQLEAFEV